MMTFDDWTARYMTGWRTMDQDLFLPLFAPDAEYADTPFTPVMKGTEAIAFYLSEAGKRQTDIDVDHEILADLPAFGLVRFHGTVRMIASGATVRIEGVMRIRRDAEGRCTHLDEWWMTDQPWQGNHQPPRG